jgi:flagellar motor switch protein FliG
MSAQAEAKAGRQPPAMNGAEKVAVLLLALGKVRAAKLLKRFNAEDLKLLSRSVSELRPISPGDLEVLVEEFGQKFASGVNFLGTAEEVKSLLSGVMSEDETATGAPDAEEAAKGAVWEGLSKTKLDVLRAYLIKEHPQTVALILSRIDSDAAAKAISSFTPDYRADIMCRMLAISRVSDESLGVVELALLEDLVVTSDAPASRLGIADILNRLEKPQSEAVLKSLAEVRPDDAKALKGLLFTFEDLATLPQAARTTILDQVPVDRLILALKGTEAAFQGTILSSLTARSKRMAEAELQGGTTAPAREIADARRSIVDTVLKMAAKGSIELRPPDDDVDAITA